MGPLILGHARESVVGSVVISRDGTLIVSGSSDCMVRRWEASTGEAVSEPIHGHDKVVSAVAICDCGNLIDTGYKDGTIMRWNDGTG